MYITTLSILFFSLYDKMTSTRKTQKGGVKLGSGTYGVVYGEPGLPAITRDGTKLPVDRPYVSKVFIEQEIPFKFKRYNDEAEKENAVRIFLQTAFQDKFDMLHKYMIIPWGQYYIDSIALREQWHKYYNKYWLGRKDSPLNKQGVLAQRWLLEARNNPPNTFLQVITEQGKYDLNTEFFDSQNISHNALANRISKTFNILKGIQILQSKNIIHGDLKEGNILVTMNDIYKIIDLAEIIYINSITPTNLRAVRDGYEIKSTNEHIAGVISIIPNTVSYYIWPAVVAVFSARTFPLSDGGGTGGAPLTLEKYISNWMSMEEWNTSRRYIEFQLQRVIPIIKLINDLNLQDIPLGEAYPITDEYAFQPPITITGNEFIKNILNTYILEISSNSNPYNKSSYSRENPREWFIRNQKAWNQADPNTLLRRIDIFSFGIILIGSIMLPVMDGKSKDNPGFYTDVLKIIVQCCTQLPKHIMRIDEDIIARLSLIYYFDSLPKVARMAPPAPHIPVITETAAPRSVTRISDAAPGTPAYASLLSTGGKRKKTKRKRHRRRKRKTKKYRKRR